jgi:DUF971 family protein
MNPRIKEVIPLSDYQLKLIFTNGEQGIYDCTHLLNFGVFQELKNKTYFNQVKIENGTVTWPHEQDICPDTLYLDSVRSPTSVG